MPVLGDLYDIDARVREFDPTYYLRWNDSLKRYQVIANKRKLVREGVHNGRPLFAMREYGEVVFTWEVEGMPPDMRIIWRLHETDIWNYPGGPAAYYDDMMARSEKRREKREAEANDFVEYTANEYAPYVKDEIEGTKMHRTHQVSKVV